MCRSVPTNACRCHRKFVQRKSMSVCVCGAASLNAAWTTYTHTHSYKTQQHNLYVVNVLYWCTFCHWWWCCHLPRYCCANIYLQIVKYFSKWFPLFCVQIMAKVLWSTELLTHFHKLNLYTCVCVWMCIFSSAVIQCNKATIIIIIIITAHYHHHSLDQGGLQTVKQHKWKISHFENSIK